MEPENWTQAIGLLTTDDRFARIESPLLLEFAKEVAKLQWVPTEDELVPR